MQIKINDTPLDFTLEREETLGEVVRELKTWLHGSEFVLYSVKHRDRDLLNSPPEQWEGTAHSEVDELEVTVRQTRDLREENLDTVLEYLDLLAAAVDQGNDGKLADLSEGFAAMAESIAGLAHGETPLQGLSALVFQPPAQPLAAWNPERKVQARTFIDRLAGIVGSRLEELRDPRRAVRELADALASCREEAEGVPILLQTGRDREAMETIVRFSEVSQRLARVLHSLAEREGRLPSVGTRSLAEYYNELNGFLEELVTAFTAQDSVLIGDLMEYEVAPRLEELRASLEAML